MVECPICGNDMNERHIRIKWQTPTGKSKASLKRRSVRRRVWWCNNCNKPFALLQRLCIVEEAFE